MVCRAAHRRDRACALGVLLFEQLVLLLDERLRLGQLLLRGLVLLLQADVLLVQTEHLLPNVLGYVLPRK